MPQDLIKTINEYGGKIKETYGVPVSEIQEGIKHGVRKVNVDTDLRLAATAAVRKYFHENPHKIKEMGNNGYKTAQKSSTWDNYGDRWQAFLNELIIKNKEVK